MSPLALGLLAVGLAADAFAVSVAKGVHMRRLMLRPALALAITFGLFQGLMPVIGWALGSGLERWIAPWDHWIALVLLVGVGGKMIWEARGTSDGDDDSNGPLFGVSVRELLVLGIATSIDALAVGVTLAFVDVQVWVAALVIAAVTFAMSMVGVRLGHHAGRWLRSGAEVVGGLILIGIGINMVVEHLAG